jgi:hypothetical protein
MIGHPLAPGGSRDYSKPTVLSNSVSTIALPLGLAQHIKIGTEDRRQLSWAEVYECFADHYPGRWAIQFFPPREQLTDETNVYHLYVLDGAPEDVGL